MAKQNTEVKNISDDELNDILAIPGVNTPDNAEKKTIFTDETKKSDQILDDELSDEDKLKTEQEKKKKEEEDAVVAQKKKDQEEAEKKGAQILDEHLSEEEEEEEGAAAGSTANKNAGRPKLDKSLMVEAIGELVKEGTLLELEFSDKEGKTIEKKLEDYTQKDVVEMIKANLEQKQEELQKKVPEEFFETLSPELKYLAKYEYDGGKNLVPVLKALLRLEENKALDPENEKDQEAIIRQFYHTTEFGTEEEIEAEITSIKDHNELEKKAKQFKPKLDAKHNEQIQQDITRQEQLKKQQQEEIKQYVAAVGSELKKGELSGIKLDKKIQEHLFVGLTSAQFPLRNGKNTNLLGYLLEQHQVVKPNHSLVLEALWLLSNPDEYKAKVKESAIKNQGERVFRTLKDAEKNKDTSGAATNLDKDDDKVGKRNKIKPRSNFFARTG